MMTTHAGEEKISDAEECKITQVRAIERIVQASDGHLNWSHELPMASWNCVDIVADGVGVRLGVRGDNKCGFVLKYGITLHDIVIVFGSALFCLDVNGQKKCTGESNQKEFYYFQKHVSQLMNFAVLSKYSQGNVKVFEETTVPLKEINLQDTWCSGKICDAPCLYGPVL